MSESALDRRRRLLGPAYRLLYAEPLRPVRGEGVWLIEADGRRVLDAYNNVPSVGHCHPRVVEALARQAAALNTHTRYLHDAVLDYAERLLATCPPPISQAMFTCTGSEANDLALRIARCVTGGTGVVVTANAYHGVTAALAEMSPSLGAGVALGPHVRTVPAPRDPETFARDVAGAFDALAAAGVRPAALLFDTLFTSDGVFPDPPGLVAGACASARRAGALVIADEVQAGLGRTGTHMWGFARHGIVPDLVTAGKPLGAGHPVAAVMARPEHLAEFGARSRYFNTFGGSPVSAAVGLAVLDVIRDEGLIARAAASGALLRARLLALAARHGCLGAVRGAGLYLGVEVAAGPAAAARLVEGLRRRGVLVGLCGAAADVIKIRPPLVFGAGHAVLLADRMDEALSGDRLQ
ncbi:aspartate aminotransferase family protein [Lichenibacterium dinghuense]|uniref:aspartate aminotransferase family protein n=1 Tax=Lichenibacterium dinghuense TaxID=2895977 RepID=UPI001F02E8F0|nr:aminotransferase class III-fold pyridoxal phosphate-dependent enzyme [Lichenibacterium sp. 6Y81]